MRRGRIFALSDMTILNSSHLNIIAAYVRTPNVEPTMHLIDKAVEALHIVKPPSISF